MEKLGYMHDNPVKRGLVPKPEQWSWSSYRSYAYGEAEAVKSNEWGKAIGPHLCTNRKGGPPALEK